MGSVIEILILQSLAFQGRKDTGSALAALERALALAEPEGYVRMFLDEGESMTRLLCQVRSRETKAGYAADLLARIGRISGMTQPSMQLLAEPLTMREVEVLKLIKSGCSNQEIAKQLVHLHPHRKASYQQYLHQAGGKKQDTGVGDRERAQNIRVSGGRQLVQ